MRDNKQTTPLFDGEMVTEATEEATTGARLVLVNVRLPTLFDFEMVCRIGANVANPGVLYGVCLACEHVKAPF